VDAETFADLQYHLEHLVDPGQFRAQDLQVSVTLHLGGVGVTLDVGCQSWPMVNSTDRVIANQAPLWLSTVQKEVPDGDEPAQYIDTSVATPPKEVKSRYTHSNSLSAGLKPVQPQARPVYEVEDDSLPPESPQAVARRLIPSASPSGTTIDEKSYTPANELETVGRGESWVHILRSEQFCGPAAIRCKTNILRESLPGVAHSSRLVYARDRQEQLCRRQRQLPGSDLDT
jgi:hypothetical protein